MNIYNMCKSPDELENVASFLSARSNSQLFSIQGQITQQKYSLLNCSQPVITISNVDLQNCRQKKRTQCKNFNANINKTSRSLTWPLISSSNNKRITTDLYPSSSN